MSKNILDEIVANTHQVLDSRKKKISFVKLKEQVVHTEVDSVFINAIASHSEEDIALIGEIKLSAPSAGDLATEQEVVPTAVAYQEAGINAISVITDHTYFKGDIEFIGRIKNHVSIPILQKDFIIDEYQIYEAAKAGSDALLLIARIVNGDTLRDYVLVCRGLGIEPVVEIYDAEDMEKAVASGARVMAVNARDLSTFDIDIDHACELLEQLEVNIVKLGFSGVFTRSDVEKYAGAGARGVLVGTSLMKAASISEFVAQLKGV